MFGRIAREPLLHFLLISLAIFGISALIGGGGAEAPERIIVTASRIEQLATIYAKTGQRPPTEDELKGLIDDYVKEEIFSREAKKLGLDQDDTVIRRRLRQKMEFLNDAEVEQTAPTDAEIEAYLEAHQKEFEVDPMLAFEQVYLSPQRRGSAAEQDAASFLKILLTNPGIDVSSLGDPSLLPVELPLTTKTSIAQAFGSEFADSLDNAAPNQWTGPVRSGFGLHLVRVSEHIFGHVPALQEIRDPVVLEWKNAKREEIENSRLKELLKHYDVIVEPAVRETKP
ncbi:peptidyl-prolyl cis-trans isomerase [Rhizobium leguminosarum]|uniref:peptidylprolyl isomerase n=1 Tax=Rhizobium leguminosarum TaxID=384 RepID=UPI001C944083|nr:peptidylprolyl isomerase [Rhizobium leguminosarum]MBY5333734.1 peptidyl-prolyl cis-trans isomerase [Rhizobium leguminosarum]